MIPYQCAPEVHPITIAAIVRVESGGNPLALHDNTTGRSYKARDRSDATRILQLLLSRGHSVDAGLMQINSRNFKRVAVDSNTVFDACQNVRAGGSILTDAWVQSTGHYKGQAALFHAVEVYNSGNLDGAPEYARAVFFNKKVGVSHTKTYLPSNSQFSVAWGL